MGIQINHSVEVSDGSAARVPPQLPSLMHNQLCMARAAGNSIIYGMATPYGRSLAAPDAIVEMTLETNLGA